MMASGKDHKGLKAAEIMPCLADVTNSKSNGLEAKYENETKGCSMPGQVE